MTDKSHCYLSNYPLWYNEVDGEVCINEGEMCVKCKDLRRRDYIQIIKEDE